MSEEKVRGVHTFIAVVLICMGLFAAYQIVMIHHAQFEEKQLHTKTLTILHTWEEGGQYYFADELGCVYHIACERDLWAHPQEELRYDDMPKTRFEKLEVGHRYNVEYVIRQGNVRLSLGEGEMVR